MQNTFTHRVPSRDHSKNKNHVKLKDFISFFPFFFLLSGEPSRLKPNELITLIGKFSAGTTAKVK